MSDTRHMLVQDRDGHWFVIPVEQENAWDAWCRMPEDDSIGWTPPSWADAVCGSPRLVTFTNPIIE